MAAIKANLASTGFGSAPAVRVVRADVLELLASEPRGRATTSPLSILPTPLSDWSSLLRLLKADVAVLETATAVKAAENFGSCRRYRYGGTLVTLVEAHGLGHDVSPSTEKDHL